MVPARIFTEMLLATGQALLHSFFPFRRHELRLFMGGKCRTSLGGHCWTFVLRCSI
jgi:hypothetical protein